jgi:transposase
LRRGPLVHGFADDQRWTLGRIRTLIGRLFHVGYTVEGRDLIIVTHQHLAAPVVWCWDNLSIHLAPELAGFAAGNKDWLRIYRMPACAPELNPAEGIWSLLKRAIASFAAPSLDHLVRIIKRKLKKIQYRPHLIDGCLAKTGLAIEAW